MPHPRHRAPLHFPAPNHTGPPLSLISLSTPSLHTTDADPFAQYGNLTCSLSVAVCTLTQNCTDVVNNVTVLVGRGARRGVASRTRRPE